jgi:hypothetical protein
MPVPTGRWPVPWAELIPRRKQAAAQDLAADAEGACYPAVSSAVKIILRTAASSWRRTASAAVARPSGEANAACRSSRVSHSSSAIR